MFGAVARSTHQVSQGPQKHPGNSENVQKLSDLLAVWAAEQNSSSWDALSIVNGIAELVESETEKYLKQDPDPFDDRHPGRVEPNSTFGHMLKVLFREEEFVSKLLNSYLMSRESTEDLRVASARLLLDLVPGLETSVFFQETEDILPQLFRWAQDAQEPLRSYAIGLLGAAMEVADIASNHRDQNMVLVPILLRRLRELKEETQNEELSGEPNFAGLQEEHFNSEEARPSLSDVLKEQRSSMPAPSDTACTSSAAKDPDLAYIPPPPSLRKSGIRVENNRVTPGSKRKSGVGVGTDMINGSQTEGGAEEGWREGKKRRLLPSSTSSNLSNSSWAEMEVYLIGKHWMYPLSRSMQQRLIIQYLTPVGEYQDLLSHVFEQNALDLIFYYADMTKSKDVRMAFDSLRYLSALLVHRKFALEFVAHSGVEFLLGVFRSSMASAAVSLCLYYMAYNEDVMEKVCLLARTVLEDCVDYMLWLLEHSYESGRCYATMFFTHSFQFRSILELFDQKDGLRKLLNYISTLTILQVEDVENPMSNSLSEDQMYQSRQAVRNVCTALRNYFGSHLWIKMEQIRRNRLHHVPGIPVPHFPTNSQPWKAIHMEAETLRGTIWYLLHVLPSHIQWRPVEELRKLLGVKLLLKVIGEAGEWNFAARTELLKSSLEVLWICSIVPKVQYDLCESVTLHDGISVLGIGILLGLCDGEEIGDPEVQKASLNVLIACVSGPYHRAGGSGRMVTTPTPGGGSGGGGGGKKTGPLNPCDLLEKVWDTVRANNGIMVLRNLLFTKTPITEADSTRALACRALDGLARSGVLKQILSKMPLISSNELYWLMREPVLQDKRAEHTKFCEYGRSLIERVTGKPASDFSKDLTHEKLWQASVVAQTKIIYNEKELLQLIHQHLMSKGFTKAAGMLQSEAELPNIPASLVSTTPAVLPPLPRILPISVAENFQRRSSMRLTGGTQSMIGGISAYLNGSADYHAVHGSASGASRSSRRISGNTPSTSGGQRIPLTPTTTPREVLRFNLGPESSRRSTVSGRREAYKPVSAGGVGSPLRGLGLDKPVKPHMSLEAIVTEYLRKQHALCRNPVAACPPFSLL